MKFLAALELAGFTYQGAQAIVDELIARLQTPSENPPEDEVFVDKRSSVVGSRQVTEIGQKV